MGDGSLNPVRVSPGGPREPDPDGNFEWVASLRERSSAKDIYTEWGVDCRDQPEAFACILTFQSKGDAMKYAEQTGRPVLKRRTVLWRVNGDWESVR